MYKWTDECQSAFQTLKILRCSETFIGCYNPTKVENIDIIVARVADVWEPVNIKVLRQETEKDKELQEAIMDQEMAL